MTIRRIGLVVNDGKSRALEAADIVRAWAGEHGVPCTDVDVWEDLTGPVGMTDTHKAASAEDPDLIVTIGGDGTLLRGVRVAAPVDALVLGVDLGRVGFLTEVGVDDLYGALDAVHRRRGRSRRTAHPDHARIAAAGDPRRDGGAAQVRARAGIAATDCAARSGRRGGVGSPVGHSRGKRRRRREAGP